MADEPTIFQGEPPSAVNWGLLVYRINQQDSKINELEEHIRGLERQAIAREDERRKQERKQLVAGIMFLGSVITALGGLIWSYRAVIFRGM